MLSQFGCAVIAGHSDFGRFNSITQEKIIKIIISVSAYSLLVAGSLFASSLQEQNEAIAKRAFEEILSKGRFELAEQLYAKDFVNHGIHRDATLEEDQAALKGWHQAFSDIAIVPEKLIAEGLGHDLLDCPRD